MIPLVFGLFGLIVGSFLNVVILRHGERSIGGRSACMSCARPLSWFDMIPVVSWLALRGRCRQCGARISIQYPLVEAVTGLLFALIGGAPLLLFAPAGQLLACVILALLIAITVYDIYYKIIPDAWAWPFVALAFVSVAFSFQLSAFSLLAGPIAALPLFSLWLVSRGAWMGFGDVKLALGIGWLLGFPYGLVSVFFAFVLGAVISVGVLMPLPQVLHSLGITRLEGAAPALTMKSEVPFGPFLIASCLIIWFSLLYQVPVPIFSGI